MKRIDEYHRWVEWSDEDRVYIGKCPDLITGIHGDDPVQVYKELSEVVQETIDHFEAAGRPLPPHVHHLTDDLTGFLNALRPVIAPGDVDTAGAGGETGSETGSQTGA